MTGKAVTSAGLLWVSVVSTLLPCRWMEPTAAACAVDLRTARCTTAGGRLSAAPAAAIYGRPRDNEARRRGKRQTPAASLSLKPGGA